MNVSWYKNEIQPEKNWAQLKESTVLSFQELTEVDRTDGGGLSVLTGNRVTLLSRKTDHTLRDGAWSWGALYIMADVEKETGSSM